MADKELSKILIEPKNRIVETLRLAMLDVGVDELIRRTGTTADLLEKWINGKEWVPLDVVKEACEINRSRQDVPSHFKVLSECTSGAQFRMTAGEQVEKPTPSVVREVSFPKGEILAEKSQRPTVIGERPDVSRQIVKVAVALFMAPLIGAAIGFLLAGPPGAVTGTISSFAVVTVLAFFFLSLFPRKRRET